MSGDVAALGPRTNRQASVCVRLIEGFELCVDGHAVEAPSAAQRLVAFLALHPRPLTRSYIAGSLWLDKTDSRATSNLRSSRGYASSRPALPPFSPEPGGITTVPPSTSPP